GLKPLTPHCCRHGFATTMLHARNDVKPGAQMGGWTDVATVVKHYAHAMADTTVTDVIFDTNLTQDNDCETLTNYKQKGKSA
ncbi:MAG: tyrosine-type recombinase/integrase, partial [Paracoccaceae bacterium]